MVASPCAMARVWPNTRQSVPGQTGRMDPAPFLASIEAEGAATLRAGRAGLDAPVPTCEGWTVHDVVGHLGRVHRSVSEIIERRSVEIPAVEIPKAPAGEAVLAFFDEGLDRLVAALGRHRPRRSRSTRGRVRASGRFYYRRMAHELADPPLRRRGRPTAAPGPFDPDMSVDGDRRVLRGARAVLGPPLGAARCPPGACTCTAPTARASGWCGGRRRGGHAPREHAKGDVAVRGSASDLFRFVWNRGAGDELEVLGDEAVADEWAALAP